MCEYFGVRGVTRELCEAGSTLRTVTSDCIKVADGLFRNRARIVSKN
jgi:hypothetical protein